MYLLSRNNYFIISFRNKKYGMSIGIINKNNINYVYLLQRNRNLYIMRNESCYCYYEINCFLSFTKNWLKVNSTQSIYIKKKSPFLFWEQQKNLYKMILGFLEMLVFLQQSWHISITTYYFFPIQYMYNQNQKKKLLKKIR
jgi:hypothetical protein